MSNSSDFEQAAAALAAKGACVTAMKAMHDAVLDRTLGRERVAVFVVICNHLNADNGMAWPSRERIAELTGMSVKTVANALYDLRKRGLVLWDGPRFTLPSGAGKTCPAGRAPGGPGNAQPGGQSCPAGRAKQHGGPGKNLPVTRARDSEPTKGTTDSDSDGTLFGVVGEETQLPVGVHATSNGLLVVGVHNAKSANAGKRFETPISKALIAKCAKDARVTDPELIERIARAITEPWAREGYQGLGKGGLPVDANFALKFAATAKAFAEAAAFTPLTTAPRRALPPIGGPDDPYAEPPGGWVRPKRIDA